MVTEILLIFTSISFVTHTITPVFILGYTSNYIRWLHTFILVFTLMYTHNYLSSYTLIEIM